MCWMQSEKLYSGAQVLSVSPDTVRKKWWAAIALKVCWIILTERGVHLCHGFCPMMATIFDGQSREQPVFLKDRIGQRIPVMVHTEPLFKGQETLGAYEAAKTQYDKTCEAIQYRKARSRQMDSFIKELRNQELIKEFDARLWSSLVDFITVYSKDDIRVTFKNGIEY